ncbi:MAG TPA: hypothetical protein VK600_00480 [Candidatus Saccharimonadales bacterium]|nr:hypothetical protein [Candidatus Saccharimonadales bacterium]
MSAMTQRVSGRRRPVLMTVERHEAVGKVMDLIAITQDAMGANGGALTCLTQARQQTPGNGLLQAATLATFETHTALTRLLGELREQAGALDGSTT